MNRHSMMYEGRGKGSRGKRKAVKTKKKQSAVSRQLKAAKRTVLNVFGGFGVLAFVIWAIQFVASGR